MPAGEEILLDVARNQTAGDDTTTSMQPPSRFRKFVATCRRNFTTSDFVIVAVTATLCGLLALIDTDLARMLAVSGAVASPTIMLYNSFVVRERNLHSLFRMSMRIPAITTLLGIFSAAAFILGLSSDTSIIRANSVLFSLYGGMMGLLTTGFGVLGGILASKIVEGCKQSSLPPSSIAGGAVALPPSQDFGPSTCSKSDLSSHLGHNNSSAAGSEPVTTYQAFETPTAGS